MSWTPPSLANYNVSPPPDDNSKTPANLVSWATIKNKLTDPLKNWLDAINSSLATQISLISTPVGSILLHGVITNPNTSVWLDLHNSSAPGTKREVSRSTYAALFSAIGTTWGSGDGSTTFHLPPSGFHLFTAAPGRIINSIDMNVAAFMDSNNAAHTHAINDPTHSHAFSRVKNGTDGSFGGGDISAHYDNYSTDARPTGITIVSQGTYSSPMSFGFGAFIRYA